MAVIMLVHFKPTAATSVIPGPSKCVMVKISNQRRKIRLSPLFKLVCNLKKVHYQNGVFLSRKFVRLLETLAQAETHACAQLEVFLSHKHVLTFIIGLR